MESVCKKVGDEPTMADGAMPYLQKFGARNALGHQTRLCFQHVLLHSLFAVKILRVMRNYL
jgi:hypothetical protein